MSAHPRLLVVDPDDAAATRLMHLLGLAGYEASRASTVDDACALLGRAGADVVLLAFEGSGLRGLTKIAGAADDAHVVLLASPDERAAARRGLRLGAYDVVDRGDGIDALLHAIERATRERQLRRDVATLRSRVHDAAHQALVGRSTAMERVRELVGRAAASRITVFVTGEAGTGKDLVARLVHDLSDRAGRPFVVVRCDGAAPEALEEELFGTSRGGLLETARGGTLVLDEVGAIPRALRARLAHLLVERVVRRDGAERDVPVDVRIVLTSRVPREGGEGSSPDELLDALTLLPIAIPPLRDRRCDIPLLVQHLRQRHAHDLGVELPPLSPEAVPPLLAREWPGNVRELDHWMERSAHTAVGAGPGQVAAGAGSPGGEFAQLDGARLSLEELERRYILHVLAQEEGHQSRAADRLGIDRRTLYRKLKEYRAGCVRARRAG
jgi:two-component system response regulator HydG